MRENFFLMLGMFPNIRKWFWTSQLEGMLRDHPESVDGGLSYGNLKWLQCDHSVIMTTGAGAKSWLCGSAVVYIWAVYWSRSALVARIIKEWQKSNRGVDKIQHSINVSKLHVFPFCSWPLKEFTVIVCSQLLVFSTLWISKVFNYIPYQIAWWFHAIQVILLYILFSPR